MTPDTFYWAPEPCQPLAVTTAAGLAVAADVRGQGSGVILVHGLGFDRSHWVEQAERLATAGHRVVTYDLRGFGDSEPSPSHYLAADLAEDLEAVRTAAGLERFHLVGHSLGGMVAQHYVLNHPDRVSRLVLASTTSHSGVRASAYGSALARLSAKGFDKAMEDPDLRAGLMATVQMLNDPEIRASASLSKGVTASTGPKTSSCQRALSRATSTKTWGATNPGPSPSGTLPAQRRLAPSAVACSIRPRTPSACFG